MNKLYQDYDGKTWARVSRPRARTLALAGYPVIMVPWKCRLAYIGAPICRVDVALLDSGCTFSELVERYAWYNCCFELGYYPAFYVPVNDCEV